MKILLTAVNAKFIHSSLAVKCLSTYAKEFKENICIKEFTINNDEDFILREIFYENADIVCFSCYLWNVDLIKRVAENLKKVNPKVLVIFGGPEVSYDSEEFMKENEFVDIIIRGEGEATFNDICRSVINSEINITEIDGITYRFNDDIFSTNPRRPISLDELDFVYENLDDYENKIIYYETQRGCPYNCQYCLSSVEKGVRFLSEDRVKSDLEFFLKNNVKQVKFVDRTFNCNKKHAMMIWRYIIENDNNITNFHMEITADIMDDEMLELLKKARKGLFQFEIGVQSTNKRTIEAIKRNTDFDELSIIVNKIKSMGNIHQHLDLIAGLPYEDYESFKKSFNDVYNLEPEQLQLGFLKLLKGSGLRYDAKKYGIKFRKTATYEFLETDWLSYSDTEKLKDIEEMVETFYNSEKALNTLKYAIFLYSDPFSLYENLALYWTQKGHNKIQHNKMELYKILYEFILEDNILNKYSEIFKCFLRFDIFINDNIKNIPVEITNNNSDNYKDRIRIFFNNSENIENYLFELRNYSPAQLARMCHVEIFDYNIIDFIKNKDLEIRKKETYILFDYYSKKSAFGHENYEIINI